VVSRYRLFAVLADKVEEVSELVDFADLDRAGIKVHSLVPDISDFIQARDG
jgi:hypothetical protein